MQLFSTTTGTARYDVVFNLYEAAPGLFLPNAYVVSIDRQGLPAHLQQKALPETIGAFQLALTEERRSLFRCHDELQPRALEERFKPPKKRVRSLEQLMEDRETARAIQRFVHRRLDAWLSQIVRHRLLLSWAVERRVLVKDFIIALPEVELTPHLFFSRSPEGVRYRLRLDDGEGPWPVRSREVIPITNHPAWLFVDYRLYRVADINGNMVKPFRQKDEVHIPKAKVRTYFQKFILKVAERADIESEGFALVQQDELQGCRLRPVRDLFSDRWVLAVDMIYPGVAFNWGDRKGKRTTLQFGEADDEITIRQVLRRPEQEQIYIDRLAEWGLFQGEGSFFHLEEQNDPYYLLTWLGRRRSELEAAGFELGAAYIEEQLVQLQPGVLTLEPEQYNDWFDLHGEVAVGAFRIPFIELAKYIRDDNRFYPLPDGSIFLIPEEWMSRYRALAQFARPKGRQLRLAKSQYTLLQELGLRQVEVSAPEQGAEDFRPPATLKAQLRPYQLDGLQWLVSLFEQDLGACLADDMGLGKTLQTIGMLLYAKEQRRHEAPAGGSGGAQLDLFGAVADADFLRPLNALIVLPASLVFNWAAELRKFAPSLSIYQHVGSKRHKDMRVLARFDLILTTYQTALRDVDLLEQLEYEYIVLDESQQIKNKDSKVFRAVNQLTARHKISLSGTPIENSLSDLWAQMQFINPDLLGSYRFFRREFILPIEKHQDEEKKERLRKLVAPYLLRRTKEEVATDLPPLTTQVFYSEMTGEQKKLYEREKSKARNFLLEHFDAANPNFRMQVLQSLTRLRQLVNHPRLVSEDYAGGSGKFQDVLEHWDQVKRSGHKVLLFSSFVQHLDLFREALNKQNTPFSWLTGDLSIDQRARAIENFERDPAVQAFLISIKAGGSGLNLTAADYVFILDPWWNPTIEQQAIARAHRIGQDKHVFALKFITRDSIEEKILKLQQRKEKLAEGILAEAGKMPLAREDIQYLFE